MIILWYFDFVASASLSAKRQSRRWVTSLLRLIYGKSAMLSRSLFVYWVFRFHIGVSFVFMLLVSIIISRSFFFLFLSVFFFIYHRYSHYNFFFYIHFISFCFCTLHRTTFIVFTYLMIGLKAQRNARLELCKRNKTKRNNPKIHRFQCTYKDICRKDKMRQNLLIYFD